MTELVTPSATAYRDALKAVIDPEIYQNIVDLGLVYGVSVAESPAGGDAVMVTMTLTSPQCPLGPQIMADVERVLLAQGAQQVQIELVWQPAWTPDAMTNELKLELGLVAEQPTPIYIPPPSPKKKGWLSRLFGG